MEDLPNPDRQQDEGAQVSHDKVCIAPDTGSRKMTHGSGNSSPSKSKMEIHVESERSVVLNFFSDSSDDNSDDERLSRQSKSEGKRQSAGGRRGREGHSRKHLSPPTQAGKPSSSDHGSIFSESDDDFCFVDTPTSTKVVRIISTPLLCIAKGE